MGMEPMWRLQIMARVGDAIMENGGLALEDGWSFWTELTKVEEKDRKDGFLGGTDNFWEIRRRQKWGEEWRVG
jgi:hypothetical protein